MTYIVLPDSGQTLGVSRPKINTNFSLIQSVFDLNHVTFNNSGAGKHRMMQMPVVQAASPGTAAGEIALYTKTAAVTAKPELFWQPESIAAAGADVQMTNSTYIPATFNATTAPAAGVGNAVCIVTFLPGKYIFVAGQIVVNSASVVVTLPFNVSVINSVQLTQSGAISGNLAVTVTAITPASFTVTKAALEGFYFTLIATGV